MDSSKCPTCGYQTTHNQYCAKFKDFLEKHPCPPQNGSISYKLAVQLEEEATEFGLIWLACQRRDGNTATEGYDEPNLDIYLQTNYIQASPPKYEPLKLTNIPNDLKHSIELWDYFDSSTAKPNSLAQSFSGGESKRDWRGPILFASSVIVGEDVNTRNYMNVAGLPLDFIAAMTALQTGDSDRPYGILAAHGVTVGDENLQSSLRQIPKCIICNKAAPAEPNGKSSEEASKGMKCPLCKCTVNCSTRCLDKDKANHDTLCQAFTEFTTQHPRPANHGLNTYKLGALLPENSAGVEFVWVKCELRMKKDGKKDGKNVATHHGDPRQHIGLPPSPSYDYVTLDMETTFRDSKRGIDYDHTTTLWWRDEFMIDGSKKINTWQISLEERRTIHRGKARFWLQADMRLNFHQLNSRWMLPQLIFFVPNNMYSERRPHWNCLLGSLKQSIRNPSRQILKPSNL
ncbi:hypothetical protein HYALB_00000221 [Hymenoscyphus albidus]|uniref:Suppressor of anucleate metulae protein B n=1 Tax=Hymenoscyphus albidus TaxID=595503 RepID=A0A9N9LV05_9HELO|nr:hypothetical protein HYALB_00000221 [Hymenoscyphus albidus]